MRGGRPDTARRAMYPRRPRRGALRGGGLRWRYVGRAGARPGCRTPRAEGGAGTSRADTPHINLAERFRSEIARRHTGGPRLSRPHPRRATVPVPSDRTRAEPQLDATRRRPDSSRSSKRQLNAVEARGSLTSPGPCVFPGHQAHLGRETEEARRLGRAGRPRLEVERGEVAERRRARVGVQPRADAPRHGRAEAELETCCRRLLK